MQNASLASGFFSSFFFLSECQCEYDTVLTSCCWTNPHPFTPLPPSHSPTPSPPPSPPSPSTPPQVRRSEFALIFLFCTKKHTFLKTWLWKQSNNPWTALTPWHTHHSITIISPAIHYYSLNRPTRPIQSKSCNVCLSVCLSVCLCNFLHIINPNYNKQIAKRLGKN